MNFIRKFYWLLYPILGTIAGACLGVQMDDIQSGAIDGFVLGFMSALWYWIRRAGRYGYWI